STVIESWSSPHFVGHRDGYPNVVHETDGSATKIGRRHSDDSQFVPVQANALAQHIAVATKTSLPKAVPDDAEREYAWLDSALLGQKRAAKNGLDLEDVEVIGRDEFRPGAVGIALCSQTDGSEAPDRHGRDELQVFAVVAIVHVRCGDQMLSAES